MTGKQLFGGMTMAVMAALTVFSVQADPAGVIKRDPYAGALLTYVTPGDLDGGAEVSVQELELYGPIYTDRQEDLLWFMLGGFTWHRFDIDGSGMDAQDVYDLKLPVHFIHTGYPSWLLHGTVTPAFFSDFESVDEDDFTVTLQGTAKLQLTETVALSGGGAFDRVMGDDELYPILAIEYQANEQLLLKAGFPESKVVYAPNAMLGYYAQLKPVGGMWNIHPDGQGEEFDLKEESWRLAFGMEKELSDGIWLQAAAGMELNRSYQIKDGGDDPVDADADDSLFVQVGIVVK